MTITDTDSVLVLGAGVSAPFGLSLGGDIISKLSADIKHEINALHDGEDIFGGRLQQKIRGAANSSSDFIRFPIHGTLAKSFGDTNAPDVYRIKNELEELHKLLDGQTSETIDDFIVENPSYALLAKIGIASLFIQSCYDFRDRQALLQPFSDRHFFSQSSGQNRNWVHLLINIIRQGIRSETVTEDNKVKIITFNYDKILEHVLEKQFSNTETKLSHYTDYIEILHMHGECGDLNGALSSPAETCLRWAEGIHVVNEPDVPEDIKAKREAAKTIIKFAKELYFCGFSFSGPNCRLLELDSPDASIGTRLISFCNYDGNAGISKTVKKYERGLLSERDKIPANKDHPVVTNIDEAPGSADKPLGVSDWIKQGQLGELPG